MHAAKAMPSGMTAAEMSAAAVTTAAVSAASRQRCSRQHGRDNQKGNSNPGLRHVIAPASLSAPPHPPTQMTPGGTESSPRGSRSGAFNMPMTCSTPSVRRGRNRSPPARSTIDTAPSDLSAPRGRKRPRCDTGQTAKILVARRCFPLSSKLRRSSMRSALRICAMKFRPVMRRAQRGCDLAAQRPDVDRFGQKRLRAILERLTLGSLASPGGRL